MPYSITKDYHFSASHVLDGLPDGHPCGRLHGHNYVVRVELTADRVDPVGMVFDYGDLKPFGAWIDTHLDHRHLNDVIGGNPTAETLAETLLAVAEETVGMPETIDVAVSVSETPKTWARYTR